MITDSEVANFWLAALGIGSFAAGLLIAHWWWPSRERLDREWDAGHGEGRDEGYWAGYSIGVDDERHGVAWLYDEYGDDLPSDLKNVPRPDAGASGSLPDSGSSPETGPGHEVRPAGPSPAAGRTCPACGCEEFPDTDERLSHERHCPLGPRAQGRTYSELVMLAAQDTPELPDKVLDVLAHPSWHPAFLRRSEDWLEACRAELGLVGS